MKQQNSAYPSPQASPEPRAAAKKILGDFYASGGMELGNSDYEREEHVAELEIIEFAIQGLAESRVTAPVGHRPSECPNCHSQIQGTCLDNWHLQEDQRVASPPQIAQPEPLREPHKTSPVLIWADVDQAIVALVQYLNTIPGVRTFASCQGTIGEGGPNPYPAQVMATWPTEVAERLHIEFDITELGTNWGYIHPKGANEWGGNGESQTARPDERNEDGNTAISTLRPVAAPAAQPLQVSAEQLADFIVAALPVNMKVNAEWLANVICESGAALAATPPQPYSKPILENRIADLERQLAEAVPPLVGPQRWIPVSERLPEIGTWNAIALTGGMVVADFRGGLPYSKYVTHWQPLPAPPGAEATPALVEGQPEDNK